MGERLLANKQGSRRAAEYARKFCTLVAESTWNESALKAIFHKALNNNVLTELVRRESTLEFLIDLAIKLDNLLLDCQPRTYESHRPKLPVPEPMQLGSMQVSPTKRIRWRREGLCFYCGQANRCVVMCPLKSTPAISSQQVSATTPISCSLFALKAMSLREVL